MKYENARDLIKKYIQGSATPEEEALLESWYNQTASSEPDEPGEPDYDKIGNEILQKLRRQQIKQKSIWVQVAAAASVILFLSIGGYLYHKQRAIDSDKSVLEVINKNLKPGGNKATLILGNGRVISLADAIVGEIASEAGIRINKQQAGQIRYEIDSRNNSGKADSINFNTVTTPKGGQWQLTLADGTRVWLNAASSIRYPDSFTGDNRKVTLDGEAYFEVAKDKEHPFVVKTATQDVTVLGTHFNVNSYHDEGFVKTTLLEGSVRVSKKDANDFQILTPGHAAINTANGLKVVSTDIGADVSWKNGYFTFKRADIKVVMRQFARWYDMDVEYEGKIPGIQLTGDLYRTASASQALKMLSYFNVHYRINGKKVIVTL